MKPFTRTIINLFDGKKRYLVPLYQRQYAWKVTPQLELLWADLTRAADRLEMGGGSHAPHFMGAMVISQIKTFGKEVQAYEVIDGQQRLTTFQLLLTAVRDAAEEFGSDYASEVLSYLLNDGVMATPEIERFKLWPSLVDRSAFTKLVDPKGVGAPAKEVLEDEDGVVRPAVAAYVYFIEQVRKRVCPDGQYDTFKMEKLFEALKDGLAVVAIELEGGDDPQTIFETLNSRGVDLSAGDLMRNFIFQRAVGMGQEGGSLRADHLYEKYWLPLDRWFWRTGETRGRLTRPRLDWMLVDHVAMKKADLVSAEALFEVYRAWNINNSPYPDVESELKDIEASARVHRRIVDQDKDDPLGRFGRFARAFDVNTTMPLVIYLATETELGNRLPHALALLESYVVRRDLCGLPTNNYNRFFVEAVAKLRGGDGDKIEHLAKLLASGKIDIARWPDDQELQHAWQGRAQYKPARQMRLRYMLEAIENRKRTTASEVVEIKSDLTVEHILPQKWRQHWGFEPTPGVEEDDLDIELLQKENNRDAKVHMMGNLTLLTQALNSTVSNGPFLVKMPALRAQSALVLNRELYSFAAWDESSIITRGLALLGVARKIWMPPSVPTDQTSADSAQATE